MHREIAQKLPQLSRAWRLMADTLLAEFGVSNSMAWCLIWLDRLGPEARQIDLAQAIGITQPSTVSVLNQLESAGLVERVQNPDDKRSNRLVFTDTGAALIGTIEERLSAVRRELFDGIPEEDVATMLRITDILAARIAERRG
jgi:MarR family transcriptional regulator, transcriptional regulator for hemolysin